MKVNISVTFLKNVIIVLNCLTLSPLTGCYINIALIFYHSQFLEHIINKTTKLLSLSMFFSKIMHRLLQKSNNMKGKVIEPVMYTSGRFSSYTEQTNALKNKFKRNSCLFFLLLWQVFLCCLSWKLVCESSLTTASQFFNQSVIKFFKTTESKSFRFLCFSPHSLPVSPPSFT